MKPSIFEPRLKSKQRLKFIKPGYRVNTAKDIAKPVDKENHENPGEPSEPTETAYNKLINKIDNDEDWFR